MKRARRAVNSSRRLKRAAQRTLSILSQIGVNPISMAQSVGGLTRFARDARKFRSLARDADLATHIDFFHPMVSDYGASAGVTRGHYFHQDLWAAKRIYTARPHHHLDVGSRVDGFVAHLLVFMPVTVVDVRPLDDNVSGLTFVRGDATTLDVCADGSVQSLSSLHAIEHVGLGRYGDPLDPAGATKAMGALARVLAKGGRLYFSVPIGVERVEFNAHRVFAPETVLRTFTGHGLRLEEFSAVNDEGQFIERSDPIAFATATFSCGLFSFSK